MVSSAIFGAAAGTGLALVVAMTIVVYRYYAVKRKGKYWSSLDRWPDPPGTKRSEERQKDCSEHCHDASSSHVLNCWRKQQKNYYAVQTRVSTFLLCFSWTPLCLLVGIKIARSSQHWRKQETILMFIFNAYRSTHFIYSIAEFSFRIWLVLNIYYNIRIFTLLCFRGNFENNNSVHFYWTRIIF